MKKFKITVEDAKAYLRDAATGPNGQYWGFTPAVMALLNSHDELLAILGEATVALEEKDQRIAELAVTQMTGPLSLVLKRAVELERIIEGVDQLAIDGGWTARGLSEYAKSLETRNAELEQRLQPLNFETSAEEFLAHCLKAEEISGDKQQARIKELISWFSRYYRQAANPKWLSSHVAELCYFIIKNAQAEQRLQQPIRQQYAEWSSATFGNVGPVGPLDGEPRLHIKGE